MNVHALTLADESSTICSEVNYLLLAGLPDSFVDCFDVVGDSRDVLDGSVVGDDLLYTLMFFLIQSMLIDSILESSGRAIWALWEKLNHNFIGATRDLALLWRV